MRRQARLVAVRTQELAPQFQRGLARMEQHRWLSVPIQTGHRIGRRDVPTFAAAISFQVVISLFPLLAAITAGASFFVESDALTVQILEVASFIAPQSEALLGGMVQSVTDLRGQVGLVSLLGLLWTGSYLFAALRRGLNAAVGAQQRRAFVHGRLLDLGVGLLAGAMLAVSLALTAGLTIVQQAEVLGPDSPLATLGALLRGLTIVVPLVMTTGIFALLFGVLPARPLPRRTTLLAGGVAAGLFEIGKNVFVWYVATFGNFNAVYGPLATVVVLLIWLYYSSLIVLGAAAFGSELARAARLHTLPTPPAGGSRTTG